MGSIISSEQYAARSSAPDFQAVLALSTTSNAHRQPVAQQVSLVHCRVSPVDPFSPSVPEQSVPLLVRKTRDCFALTLTDVTELLPDAPTEVVELAFRLLDSPEKGLVGACELLGVLLLLAPQLSTEAKLQGASVI